MQENKQEVKIVKFINKKHKEEFDEDEEETDEEEVEEEKTVEKKEKKIERQEKKEIPRVLVVGEIPKQEARVLADKEGKEYSLITFDEALTEIYADIKEIKRNLVS